MGLILRKTLDSALEPIVELLSEPLGPVAVLGHRELAKVPKDDTLAVAFCREIPWYIYFSHSAQKPLRCTNKRHSATFAAA